MAHRLMSMDLDGKTALVTGGAVRIGRAICEALANNGCRVVIHFNRSAAEASQLARTLRKAGVEAFTVGGDLSTEKGCERVVKQARDKAGALDILVNNAAVFHKDSLRSSTQAKTLLEFRTNLLAPMSLMKEFARTCRQGKIVNLLDRRIVGRDPECLPYVLSKKALAEATLSAALELAPGITVNAVAPGAVLAPPGKGEAYVRDLAGMSPLKSRVQPRDVAEAVVFLLRSDTITGQIVFVDGGQHLLGNA
jgi:pteridine reductase